jgi:hypothetical protein
MSETMRDFVAGGDLSSLATFVAAHFVKVTACNSYATQSGGTETDCYTGWAWI